jgi:hypothetical protein
MQELVGKKLINHITNKIKTIARVDDNNIYLTDNGIVPIANMYNHFDMYEGEAVSESYRQPVKPQISTEDALYAPVQDFSASSILANAIMAGFDKEIGIIDNNNNINTVVIDKEIGDTDEYIDGVNVSKLNPDTRKWMEQQKKQGLQKPKIEDDLWVKEQFNIQTSEDVVGRTSHAEELERVKAINEGRLPVEDNNYTHNNNFNNNQAIKSPFPPMRKTYKIKLRLELDEIIPKIEDIRAVESMFEVSLLDNIAKEIALKYLNDKQLFEDMIFNELEKIVKAKKKVVKKVVKKPIKKDV